MKGYRLILTLLIAMAFAFGTIACEKKEDATTDQPTTEEPAEVPAETPPVEEPAEVPTEEPAAEGGTNGAAAPEGGAESQ